MALTKSEHGSYFLAMMAYWKKASPLTEKEARSIMGEDFETISEYFNFKDGLWQHDRIDFELAKAGRLTKQRSGAGKASAEKRWGKREYNENGNEIVTGVITESQRKNAPSPSPSPSPLQAQAPSEKEICAEPETDSTPEVMKIPLIAKDGEFKITEAMVFEWQQTFPGVDVGQQLRRIRQWNLDMPKKRKTKAGIRSHISGWLAKEQDRSGGKSVGGRQDLPFKGAERYPQLPISPEDIADHEAEMARRRGEV